MENIRTLENLNELYQNHDSIVIDLWADWCGPCRAFAPMFESVAGQMGEQVLFAKANVDEAKELATHFGIQSIPTTLFLRNGQEVHRIAGVPSSEERFSDLIQEHLLPADSA